MKKIDRLEVKYHGQLVEYLSLTPDNRLCVFEYSPAWLAGGFSISPLELPLKPGVFIAKANPFYGNFGIYDHTLSTEGYNGQHATSVNGKGEPTLDDFIAVGTKIKMDTARCRHIIEKVKNGCGSLARDTIKG